MLTKTKFTKNDKLVILTGAGISAESGVKTFRDSDGLWENHSVDEVATPEAFNRNPRLVWDFYTARFKQLQNVKPNPAHFAIKKLQDFLGENLTLITQNIDGLHQAAGNTNIIEMHGSIADSYCNKCRRRITTVELITNLDQGQSNKCTQPWWFSCEKCKGQFRPNIVWFGEIPHHLDKITRRIQQCTKFLVIGTSGTVYPAAQLLVLAKRFGADTIGVNLDRPENVSYIDEFHQGKSGKLLPFLVAEWTS